MRLVVEILVDGAQLSDEDKDRVRRSVSEAAEDACHHTFWYREAKDFDYEVSSEWRD